MIVKESVPVENQDPIEPTDAEVDENFDAEFDKVGKDAGKASPKSGKPASKAKSDSSETDAEETPDDTPETMKEETSPADDTQEPGSKDKQPVEGEEGPEKAEKPEEGVAETDLDKAKKLAAELKPPVATDTEKKPLAELTDEEKQTWARKFLGEGKSKARQQKPSEGKAGDKPEDAGKLVTVEDVINTLPEAEREDAKAFVDDYPGAGKILAAAANLGRSQGGIPEEITETISQLSERIAAQEQYIDSMVLVQAVERVHKGAEELVKTPKFNDFLKGHPDLDPLMDSPNPAHAIALISAYKEHAVLTAKQGKDDAARRKLTEKDDLHAETLENKPKAQVAGSRAKADPDSEFESEFEKAAKEQ